MMVNLESTIVDEHRGEVDDSDEEENRDKLTLNHSGPGPTMDGPPPSVLLQPMATSNTTNRVSKEYLVFISMIIS